MKERAFILVFGLGLLLMIAGTLFFFIALVSNQTRIEYAEEQWRYALLAAESAVNEGIALEVFIAENYLNQSQEQEASFTGVLNTNRWSTNDGRYTEWGFPTNQEIFILSEPEKLNGGSVFYVCGILRQKDTTRFYGLGGAYPLKGTNPLLRLIQVDALTEHIDNTNAMQGALIAVENFKWEGKIEVVGTNFLQADNVDNGAVVISAGYPNKDQFYSGEQTIEGYYVTRGVDLPIGLNSPQEDESLTNFNSAAGRTAVESTNESVLRVGSKSFLEQGKEGYETNHFVTRLNWEPYPPKEAPPADQCTEAPIVEVGDTNAPTKVYQFSESGRYKITQPETLPMIFKSNAVVTLRVPDNFIFADSDVTFEAGARVEMFPDGNLTLKVQSLNIGEDWRTLLVWGGTNIDQEIVVQGVENKILYGKIYAPYSRVCLTNGVQYSCFLAGGKVELYDGTFFRADQAAAQFEERGSINEGHYRITRWEEIPLFKDEDNGDEP